jgi:excisionase family DNA binding protein
MKSVSTNKIGGDALAGGEQLLTPEEAAERLRIGRSYLYELMRRRSIPSIKLGRKRRIRASDIDDFITARVEETWRT